MGICAVPAHDDRDWEFAKKFGCVIIEVVSGGEDVQKAAFTAKDDTGIMVNSQFLDGLTVKDAIPVITKWLEEKGIGEAKVNYKLRDWVFSRQRYWGEPIPMVWCENKTLLQCWEDTVAHAQKATAPALIFEEESRIVGVLRDIFNPSFESIKVNDPDIYSQIKKYVSLIAPERADIVELYDKPEPIFDHYNITRQIKSSFGKTVSFKSGAYIIIEHTEALHVIDVNSGNRSKAANDQETNALEVNMRAAEEIARQLRLRDMGGIIVIDFIDMAKAEHRQKLYEHMREIMATDRARHNILPLSKFGLMQITRQRVRPALDIVTAEECPSCYGKGKVQPSLLFTDTLKEKIDYLVNDLDAKGFTMYVHPFVEAYLKKGILSTYRKWRMEYGRRFRIIPDQSLAYLQYRVLDSERNEIDLKDEKDVESSATKTKNKAKTRGKEE